MALAANLVKRVKSLFRRGTAADSPKTATDLRDAVATQGNADATELARRLAAGDITLTQFQNELYLMTRNAHIAQYTLARGGVDQLTASDKAALGKLVGEQASALRDFVGEIGNGELGEDEIAQRAALYPESAVKASSLGQMAALGIDPPDVPPLHPHCRCVLRIESDDDGPAVYWDPQDGACDECVGMAGDMSPWRPEAA